MRPLTRLAASVVTALVLAGSAVIPGTVSGSDAHSEPAGSEPIVVETLAHGFPANAPGRSLLLERITLAPGAELSTHAHPGAHTLYVDSGELSVAIVEGFAEVTWAGQATGQMLGSGDEVVLRAGDTLFEQRTLVHSAVNLGLTPVVLLAASLLTPGAPRLHLTDDPATPEPSWRPGERP